MGLNQRVFVEQRQKTRHGCPESFFFLKPIPIDRNLPGKVSGQPANNRIAEVAGYAGSGDPRHLWIVEWRKISARIIKFSDSLLERLQDPFDLFQDFRAGRVSADEQ